MLNRELGTPWRVLGYKINSSAIKLLESGFKLKYTIDEFGSMLILVNFLVVTRHVEMPPKDFEYDTMPRSHLGVSVRSL